MTICRSGYRTLADDCRPLGNRPVFRNGGDEFTVHSHDLAGIRDGQLGQVQVAREQGIGLSDTDYDVRMRLLGRGGKAVAHRTGNGDGVPDQLLEHRSLMSQRVGSLAHIPQVGMSGDEKFRQPDDDGAFVRRLFNETERFLQRFLPIEKNGRRLHCRY
jgi:hypothetical protein